MPVAERLENLRDVRIYPDLLGRYQLLQQMRLAGISGTASELADGIGTARMLVCGCAHFSWPAVDTVEGQPAPRIDCGERECVCGERSLETFTDDLAESHGV